MIMIAEQEYFNLINTTEIEKILENCGKDKKIFCFGAGTAGLGLLKSLPSKYNIDCFLDNNPNLYNEKINEIPICSPDILKTSKNFIVLVNSQFRRAICQQLDTYGLKENKDYFVIFDLFDAWWRIEKFRKTTKQFCDFINEIPDNIFDNIKVKEDSPKIGIVCMGVLHRCTPWRDITTFLLLLFNGYKVSLLIDDLSNILECYIKEHRKFIKSFLDDVLSLLTKKFDNLEIIFYNKNDKEPLDNDDKTEIEKLVNINIKYFNALVYYQFDNTNMERTKAFQNILTENMAILMAFFKSHKFDVIHLCGGVAEHQGIYSWIGKKLNFRVSTYDGSGLLGSVISSNYPATHSMDIVKTIQMGFLDEETKKRIIEMSKGHFLKRQHIIDDPKEYSFQLFSKNECKNYNVDFLIPLNISTDAAALGLDYVFFNTEEWLEETIKFILEHTNATVMIREHPYQCQLEEQVLDKDYFPLIKKYAKNPRCIYIRAGDTVNTYDVLNSVKAVLPFSSTVGLEAALMNKCVITHTSCYYSYCSFVKKANNKQEYFKYILTALENQYCLNKSQIDEAYLYYYLLMNSTLNTGLTEMKNDWMENSLIELNREKNIQKLLKVIAEEQPVCYLNIKEMLSIK